MVNHPNRSKRARLNAAAPALLEATEMLLRLVGDMMPGVRFIALPDYQLLNEAQIKGREAVAAARDMPADIFDREDLPFPGSLPEFQRLFPHDAACAAYLEAIRWRHGFVCVWCGERGEPFRFANRQAVDGLGPISRIGALKAAGNAIVPQVAAELISMFMG